ncbi:MAG: hypothetical protein NTZ59_08390 [Bacteroidetes bacterium]|jgi:hypothetical protein|nr:hypothetical protein [Bacteroidota bacterium]
MANITENITIKRLRNKYRLVVTNDDTFEEVVTFKLSRVSLYVALSSTFILLVGLTICLLVFTPLKYYIPGYGNKKSLTQLQLLKARTDSLEQAIKFNEQYLNGLEKAFKGDATLVLDTNKINVQSQPEDNYKDNSKRNKRNNDDSDDKPRRKRRRR